MKILVRNPVAALIAIAAAAMPAGAQSVQYRSPAGVEYRSQVDTGAIARAESALAVDPRNVDLIIQLGVAQSGARQFREAIATFTRGLTIAPDNALLLRWRGHRYLSVREFDRAMWLFYHKHYQSQTSPLVDKFVRFGIGLKGGSKLRAEMQP